MIRLFIASLLLIIAGCGGSSSSSTAVNNDVVAEQRWSPEPGTSWQIQLSGDLVTTHDADVYDIDLIDTPVAAIESLQAAGKRVICYFSAGSHEDWRDDASDFPSAVIGNDLDGWPGEKWLDVRDTEALMPIMEARMDIAVAKGCDGVDPDNMDGYTNNSGFPLTSVDQLNYNILIAEAAHDRGLAVGLKNDLDQIEDLVGYYDFAVNEQCFYYNECNLLLPFINTNKPVFGIEYELDASAFCAESISLNFDTLLMTYDLAGERYSCR